jgi:mitogen-activated protein kinase kinase kinase kinase 4
MSAQAPVGTTLALLERQLKVMTAVQARIHYAFKQELQLLAEIIAEDSPEDYDFDPEKGSRKSKKEDFKHTDIIPVSDPNAATMSQRVVQYQAVIQMAQMAPQIYNLPELHRRMLDVLGIKNPDKLIPMTDDQKQTDPVSENANILQGIPVKAFQIQDHVSHIAVHQAAMQDPKIQAMIGQNPQAPMIMAAAQAHLAEHTAMEYRNLIAQQMGTPLPQQGEAMPPQVEVALSAMMAKAAQQLLQQHQQAAAQQQAQQSQQDPVVQMQQQELQLRQQELQIKQQEVQIKQQQATAQTQIEIQKMQNSLKVHTDKLALDQEKTKGNLQLGAMKVGVDVQRSKHQQASQNNQAGLRTGLEIAKHKKESALQEAQMAADAKAQSQPKQPKEAK